MECAYGKFNGQYTLRVEKLLSNSAQRPAIQETNMPEDITQTIAEDDWAAAMAEQAAPAAAEPARFSRNCPEPPHRADSPTTST